MLARVKTSARLGELLEYWRVALQWIYMHFHPIRTPRPYLARPTSLFELPAPFAQLLKLLSGGFQDRNNLPGQLPVLLNYLRALK